MVGTLDRYADFGSQYVAPRHVDVWLPPGYAADEEQRYAVLYMHDGQNLFEPGHSYAGAPWSVDVALAGLIEAREVPPTIVVGVWNTDLRRQEYLPARPFASPEGQVVLEQMRAEYGGQSLSDAYLRFLIEEVKPFVDARYRTLPDRAHTFVMGSSMGGLISLYALCEYPSAFAGAGCLSTHWVAGEDIIIEYVRQALPAPGRHRVYFDHGTETLDALYEPFQQQVDQVMRAAGYREGVDWVTRTFKGAEHSEVAWRERVHIPLAFLLRSRG
ncbi:MAG: alpha/beta hydrolase [Anaerolineae bacterium]|nr:alpha/beta hydrolase [Anaerolineae bacterium]